MNSRVTQAPEQDLAEALPVAAAPAARVERARELTPLDVLRLQRTAGNRAVRAAIENSRRPVLQRLGTPLNQPVPSTEPQPIGGTAGQQRQYTPEQYIEMWEKEQGRKITSSEKDTIDRGCVGLTANNLNGGGDPPLDDVYSTFDKAYSVMKAKNATWDWLASAPMVGSLVGKARYIVFAKLFWSNQNPDEAKRKKSDPTKFVPDKTGKVDMTGYDYLEQPGMVNFDYGWWDDASKSFWHANHMDYGDPLDPMIVLQSTKEKFAKKISGFATPRFGYPDFDRVVYGVALAENYDAGLAAIASAKP